MHLALFEEALESTPPMASVTAVRLFPRSIPSSGTEYCGSQSGWTRRTAPRRKTSEEMDTATRAPSACREMPE